MSDALEIIAEVPPPPDTPIWVFEYGTNRTNRELIPTGRDENLDEIEKLYGPSYRGRREMSASERKWAWFGARHPKATDFEQFFTALGNQLAQEQAPAAVFRFLGTNLSNLRLRRVALELSFLIMPGGKSISEGMAAFPDVFTQVQIGAVKAGEAASKLDKVFHHLALDARLQKQVGAEVIKACITPMITLSVVYGAMMMLFYFMLPRIVEIYRSFGQVANLPIYTQYLVNISNVMRAQPWLACIVPSIVMVLLWKRRKVARSAFVANALPRIPFVGKVFMMGRFHTCVRTLALLVEYSVAWDDLFTLAATGTVDSKLRQLLLNAQERHTAGTQVHESVWEFPDYFGALGLRLQAAFARGVAFNSMATELSAYASELEQEFRRKITAVGKPLESGMIVFSALLILGIMTAAYLPIFKLSSVAGG